VSKLLDALREMALEKLSSESRKVVLVEFQRLLVEKVRDYHSMQRISFAYDSSCTTWTAVRDILAEAEAVGKAPAVAQYLVGAKLQLRFPKLTVSNDRFAAGDIQTGRKGDFQIADTVFHVTVAPGAAVVEKCARNLRDAMRVYLLVPDNYLAGARQNAQMTAPDKVAVESIESFIANNIEELSLFSRGRVVGGLRRLLELYNERVGEIEQDRSLLIEIPPSLA